jgi:glyoxylase-like metal-dependent hydrolase (beta-lactamase superfamily II)
LSSPKDIVEVIPDLYQIRLPIPIRSLDYVFSYLAVDGNDNLLIDSGWPGEESCESLESSLSDLGLSSSKIRRLVISHLHPDHFGLASLIQEHSPGCKVFMHRADAAGILKSQADFDRFIDELHSWLGTHGTPDSLLVEMLKASRETLRFFELPRPNVLVNGGELIAFGKWSFEVLATPGHTVGTICLYDKGSKTLFSGDHILPTITPNISLGPRYMGNPLGDYLDSLKNVRGVEAEYVLPSHERIFSNLGERIQEIEHHHEERLDEALSIIASSSRPQTAFEIASKLRWNTGKWEDLTPWDKRAALMETLAHLKYLEELEQVREIRDDRSNKTAFALIKKGAKKDNVN